jgi:hypothetical protein
MDAILKNVLDGSKSPMEVRKGCNECRIIAEAVREGRPVDDIVDKCVVDLLVQKKGGRSSDRQGSSEWLEERRKFITGSVAASVLGRSYFSSVERVAGERIYNQPPFKSTLGWSGEDVMDGSPPGTENPACEWGNLNESLAIDHFESLSGHVVIRDCPLVVSPVKTDENGKDLFAASPDGMTLCGKVIEVKCPWAADRLTRHRLIPASHACQVALLMHCTRSRHAIYITFRPAGYRGRGVKDETVTEPFINTVCVTRVNVEGQLVRHKDDSWEGRPRPFPLSMGTLDIIDEWVKKILVPAHRLLEGVKNDMFDEMLQDLALSMSIQSRDDRLEVIGCFFG